MNEEQTEIINKLKSKVVLVKHLYDRVADNNERLIKEKNELILKIEEQSNIIADLERKYKSLQLAKAVSVPGESNEEARGKIDGLVKEIDKCIALLNK